METQFPSEREHQFYPLQQLTLDLSSGPLPVAAPLLRISACGMLTIDVLEDIVATQEFEGRYSRLSSEQMRGRNHSQALILLKLLISRPHRHAPKDWLMEHLGREGESITDGRLDDLASKLRGILCGSKWEHLRKQVVQYAYSSRGSGYQLAASPLVWLDTDAITWNVEQAAHLERYGEEEEAIPLWERAYQLASRGDYLSDEVYSEWAQERRAQVKRALRQSVHALARLLVITTGKQGETQALHLLSDYCSASPLDEDVLRPLIELLGKHERYGEALAWYERACEHLREEGLTPDAKTHDIAEYLRTKQLVRPTSTHPISRSLLQSERSATLAHPDAVPFQHFSEGRAGSSLKSSRRQFLHSLVHGGSTWVVGTAGMQPDSSDVLARLAHVLNKPAMIDEATLAHLETKTRQNRQDFVLSKQSALLRHTFLHDVWAHFQMVSALLEYPLPMPSSRRLCTLVGETSQLIGDLLFNAGDNQGAKAHYAIASDAATEAENRALLAVVLGRRSFLPLYTGDARQALPFLQEAQEYAQHYVSDTVLAWLWAVEAEVCARIQESGKCMSALEQSESCLHRSEQRATPSSFAVAAQYSPFHQQRLLAYKGTCLLSLRQPQTAQAVLQEYLSGKPTLSAHTRSITLIDLAKAFAQQGDLETMVEYAQEALELLGQTGSSRVFQRLLALRQEVRNGFDASCLQRLDTALVDALAQFKQELC